MKADAVEPVDVIRQLLNEYPDLKGLIVPATVGALAVSKCIMDEGREVKVTSLTLASDMKEYSEAGICRPPYGTRSSWGMQLLMPR